MIVAESDGQLRLVTQTDHARFAAELLSLWRAAELARHPRRDDLLFAVREHDNGWRESDAAPRVDAATGRPHGFLTLPDEPRRELWRRGVERYREERPWAAALIGEHALRLHQGRRPQPEWAEWLDELAASLSELVEEHGFDRAELERDYLWLALADRLSLAICLDAEERFRQGGRRFRIGPGALLRIEPLPLAGASTFRIPVRLLPMRPFRGDADLGGELAVARWQHLTVRVRGGSDGP